MNEVTTANEVFAASAADPADADSLLHLVKPERRKTIAILSTGGTIAGCGAPGKSGSYKAGELPVSAILETIPELSRIADLKVQEICRLDSNDITFEHYAAIKEAAEQLDKDPKIDGIVITHGTDTLEESAFLLNLVLDVHKPVVMTGAMRPATSVSADGPMNLAQAIHLASRPKARHHGVLVVLSNSIYAARDLEKINSMKTDAFKSSQLGLLGYMQDQHVHLLHTPYGLHTSASPFLRADLHNLPQVEIFYVHQQADPRLLQYMLEHYDGVVLAGTGSGNYPKAILQVIENWKGDTLIVRASRLSEGIVYDSDEFDPKRICISARQLSAHKARLLAMLALTTSKDHKTIQKWFEEV